MLRSILPKEVNFYNYFEQHSELCIKISKELLEMTSSGKVTAEKVKEIKDLEHQMDNITHQCLEQLHKTFITPIERQDILHLITILSMIFAASSQRSIAFSNLWKTSFHFITRIASFSLNSLERASLSTISP
jgi:uncharacterized protein Yka (UPF0111/DUF47 family)